MIDGQSRSDTSEIDKKVIKVENVRHNSETVGYLEGLDHEESAHEGGEPSLPYHVHRNPGPEVDRERDKEVSRV